MKIYLELLHRNLAAVPLSLCSWLVPHLACVAAAIALSAPYAIAQTSAPGTPMSDLTNAGDSFHTNSMLDNVLVAPTAAARCPHCAGMHWRVIARLLPQRGLPP